MNISDRIKEIGSERVSKHSRLTGFSDSNGQNSVLETVKNVKIVTVLLDKARDKKTCVLDPVEAINHEFELLLMEKGNFYLKIAVRSLPNAT